MGKFSYLDAFGMPTGSTGTTDARSGYGHAPKAFLLVGNGDTSGTDSAGNSSGMFCVGIGASTTSRATTAIHFTDSSAAADVTNAAGSTSRIFYEDALTLQADWDVSAVGADGLTIEVDGTSTGSAHQVKLLSLGSGIAEAEMQEWTTNTTTGDQSVTSFSFQPDAVFHIIHYGTNDSFGIGADGGADSITSGSSAMRSENAADPTEDSHYASSAASLVVLATDGTSTIARGAVTAWLSNGFTVNWTENSLSTGATVRSLALRGDAGFKFHVGSLSTSTSTASGFKGNTPGFKPLFGILGSCFASENSSGTAGSGASLCMGMFDEHLNQGAVSLSSQDAQATTSVGAAIEFDSAYVSLLADGSNLDGTMDIVGASASGFTAQMSDADASSGRFVWYLCGGFPSPLASPIFF